jgi:predicted nucleotidyltransferase
VGDKDYILQLIKKSVMATDPGATLILYGSHARSDEKESSDIDILVLIDKDKTTREDQKRIAYPLYDIEFDTRLIISPMVYSIKAWQTHRVTPFYENVIREGKEL